jgi:hypothetical protein
MFRDEQHILGNMYGDKQLKDDHQVNKKTKGV